MLYHICASLACFKHSRSQLTRVFASRWVDCATASKMPLGKYDQTFLDDLCPMFPHSPTKFLYSVSSLIYLKVIFLRVKSRADHKQSWCQIAQLVSESLHRLLQWQRCIVGITSATQHAPEPRCGSCNVSWEMCTSIVVKVSRGKVCLMLCESHW